MRVRPERVFAAFADPAELARWWGPRGFENAFHEFRFEPGGAWRLTMRGPDGKEFPNEMRFVAIEPPRRIVVEHLSAPVYRAEVALRPVVEGCLVLYHQEFESAEMRARVARFAGAGNDEMLERLDDVVGGR